MPISCVRSFTTTNMMFATPTPATISVIVPITPKKMFRPSMILRPISSLAMSSSMSTA